ncbi:MAG: putative toxin-antitoxin system toxin component, PIN family [Chloroflexota bacterium]|nr:putative toxin-antitoxin system toxin component, PIN family [Chloroflexota bacterium]
MIVVLDTNVLVSAVLSPRGTPSRLLELAQNGAFAIAISDVLLTEYAEVLLSSGFLDRYHLVGEEIIDLLTSFARLTTIVQADQQLSVIESDPDDDRVLECAIAGGADYIVSGDKHLLGLGEYEGIRILSPAEFLRVLEQERA